LIFSSQNKITIGNQADKYLYQWFFDYTHGQKTLQTLVLVLIL